MTTATAVTPWYVIIASHLVPNFLLTKPFVERAAIMSTERRERLLAGIPPSSNLQDGSGSYEYHIWVKTVHGTLHLGVSEEVYYLLGYGEKVVVRYQRGRWTGALKGEIAR